MIRTEHVILAEDMSKPIMLLGEARGADEDRINSSFVGASGIELLNMLAEARVIAFTDDDKQFIYKYYRTGDSKIIDAIWRLHPEVARTNVFQQHPPGNKLDWFCGPKKEGIAGYGPLVGSKYVRKELEHELIRLGDEILAFDPNLIICLGNTGLWALTGATGITKVRGTTCLSTHLVSGYKLLSTYHPAAVLRQYEWRPTVILDLMKASREALFPEVRRPKRSIWIEPSLSDIRTFYENHILGCKLLSVDIETAGTRITCIGFSPRIDLAIVIPFDDERAKGGNYWPTFEDEQQCWGLIRQILEDQSIPKLFQNGAYDISFIWRSYHIMVMGASEDTMLLHHALHPESRKALGYLGSLYTSETAWKYERKGAVTTLKRDE